MRFQRRSPTNNMNTEIELLPVISVLAVLITILLVMFAWAKISLLEVRQSAGEATLDSQLNPPSLWIEINNRGRMTLHFKDFKKARRSRKVSARQLRQQLIKVKEIEPSATTVLLKPQKRVDLDMMVKVMDEVRGQGYNNIGIHPLGR